MNLVSLEKTKEGYSGVARFDYYVFNALFGGDLESEFYRFSIVGNKITDDFIGAHEKPYSNYDAQQLH